MGPRRGLIEVLRAQGIAYAVWQEKASTSWHDAERVFTEPFWHSTQKIREVLQAAWAQERFTHVIAGTEAAVVPASLARHFFKARLSKNTTVTRCRDKLLMKQYLFEHGIPMTRFLAQTDGLQPEAVFTQLGSPVVHKTRKSSGGKGVTFVESHKDLDLHKQGACYFEAFVDAPEASVESFVHQGRIQFTNVTDYAQKGHVNYVPAAWDKSVTQAVLALNARVIQALRIQWGITHLEVYLTKQGPLFGEIALRPPGGYIMNALKYAYGFNPWEAMVAVELDKDFLFPNDVQQFTAVDVFHPGAGVVCEIQGKSAIQVHPATREFKVKVKSGDTLDTRHGLGQDTGYVIHASDTAQQRDVVQAEFRQIFQIRTRSVR